MSLRAEALCVLLPNCSVRTFPILANSSVSRAMDAAAWSAELTRVGAGIVSMSRDPDSPADRPRFISTEWRVRTRRRGIAQNCLGEPPVARAQPVYVANETIAIITSHYDMSEVGWPWFRGVGVVCPAS